MNRLLKTFPIAVLLSGCESAPLLDPAGPIGKSELHLILISFALMLIVVIPVTFMAFWFPRKFSASDPKGKYEPEWSRSSSIEFVVWLVPAIIVAALATISWRATHRLDPFRPIPGNPVRIEAVSLDWKWLFIYPDLGIATIDRLVIPVNVPVSFRLTSASVMTSFFIPSLGSQVYAMGGMQTRLHLLAQREGEFTGQNQQYSGRGYADMHFRVEAVSADRYAKWAEQVSRSGVKLDDARYAEIEKPGISYPVREFSGVEPGLFGKIVKGK
ncbi:MAG: ubiquinol oxidase subunit II [Burkholderiales bacterium]|nr:ubiquinol oxidase subunit II [Burkholderiales bacterium]